MIPKRRRQLPQSGGEASDTKAWEADAPKRRCPSVPKAVEAHAPKLRRPLPQSGGGPSAHKVFEAVAPKRRKPVRQSGGGRNITEAGRPTSRGRRPRCCQSCRGLYRETAEPPVLLGRRSLMPQSSKGANVTEEAHAPVLTKQVRPRCSPKQRRPVPQSCKGASVAKDAEERGPKCCGPLAHYSFHPVPSKGWAGGAYTQNLGQAGSTRGSDVVLQSELHNTLQMLPACYALAALARGKIW